ncbi:MAG: LysR substrate-binding domain-containing protein [Pseudomonadota bacterium]
MAQLTLRQLRYFDALARAEHFGKAAEACAVTQPALSMQIKELEEVLGATLVERGGRQARLSPLGKAVHGRVRDVIQAIDELQDFSRASQARLTGRLRIGVIPTVAPYLLPRIVRAIGAAYPDTDIHLRESLTPTLTEELIDGRIDAALLALPVSENALFELALFDEEFLFVRSGDDADAPVPSADALREMRLLLLEEGHCFRDQALSFCKLESAAPREVLDASSLSTLVQMVGAGIGVTLIPEMARDVETRSANVAVCRFPAPAPKRTIGMVWRRANPLSGQLGDVAALVKEAALARSGVAGETEPAGS